MMARNSLVLLCAALLAACAPIGLLRRRAAFDLECPEEQLAIVDIDHVTKGVRGCGNKATYIWVCGLHQTCAWVMNTDATRAPSTGGLRGKEVP